MLKSIIELDQTLFFAVNDGLSNPFFDLVMPLVRERLMWIPLYVFLAFILIKKYKKYGLLIIACFLFSFGLADYSTASIIKPVVQRLRPCNDTLINVHVRNLVPCGSGYSFPSSHAANHFAMGIFLIVMFYHRWKWIMPLALLWAFIISFAQVYVGVHFPIDVTVGGLIGGGIGFGIGTILKKKISSRLWKSGN